MAKKLYHFVDEEGIVYGKYWLTPEEREQLQSQYSKFRYVERKGPVSFFKRIWEAEFFGRPWMFSSSNIVRELYTGNFKANLPVTVKTKGKGIWSDDEKVHFVIFLKRSTPQQRRGRTKHRAYVLCPECGAEVFTGRIMQHRCHTVDKNTG